MDIIIAKNYSELSRQAAMIFLNKLALKPNSVFGLATGSTPIGTYEEIRKNTKDFSYDWSRVKTFNLDEYIGLSSSHPQSYYQFMYHCLFKHINIKKNNINIPSGTTTNIQQSCQDYERRVLKNKIDIQLLGLGQNGHIGFNEPSSNIDSKTRIVNLSSDTIEANARFFGSQTKVPTQAITMGIKTILSADKIVLIAAGKYKAQAVKEMVEGKIGPSCPASFLRTHKKVTVIIDEEAASLLKHKSQAKKTGWSDLRILAKNVIPKKKNILVISPHHDDSVVSCGATIAAMTKHNHVHTLVMTAGHRAQIKNLTLSQRIKVRNAEAKKESRILDSKLILSQFKFYDHQKKFWRGDILKFQDIYRKVKPDIILLPHKYDEHPTHRLSTELVLDFLKEKNKNGLELWYYEGLWSQHILDKIDIVFSFDKELLALKNKGMAAHKSQATRLPIIEASEALSKFRAKTIPEQLMVGYGEDPPNLNEYVEAYHVDDSFQ